MPESFQHEPIEAVGHVQSLSPLEHSLGAEGRQLGRPEAEQQLKRDLAGIPHQQNRLHEKLEVLRPEALDTAGQTVVELRHGIPNAGPGTAEAGDMAQGMGETRTATQLWPTGLAGLHASPRRPRLYRESGLSARQDQGELNPDRPGAGGPAAPEPRLRPGWPCTRPPPRAAPCRRSWGWPGGRPDP